MSLDSSPSVFVCVRESVFLRGIESALQPASSFSFVGGCVDEATMFDAIPRLQPDVLVFEIHSPRVLPCLRILRMNFPLLPIVALLGRGSKLERRCLTLGATICREKTLSGGELIDTLIACGDRHIPAAAEAETALSMAAGAS